MTPPSQKTSAHSDRGIKINRTITIRKPASELYAFWRDLHNVEDVLPGRVSVSKKSDRVSHWSARAPGGHRVEWDAEIIDDEPEHLIAWRSCEGSDITNSGSVRFEPAPEEERSTRVDLAVEYLPPGGRLGALIGKATRSRATKEVAEGLRRVKERLESDASVRSD